MQLILETVPPHLSIESISKDLGEIEGVAEVHDMHIWCLNNDKFSFTCHIILNAANDGHQQRVLMAADALLRKKYDLNHNCI